jgi:hypothetical protein
MQKIIALEATIKKLQKGQAKKVKETQSWKGWEGKQGKEAKAKTLKPATIHLRWRQEDDVVIV